MCYMSLLLCRTIRGAVVSYQECAASTSHTVAHQLNFTQMRTEQSYVTRACELLSAVFICGQRWSQRALESVG